MVAWLLLVTSPAFAGSWSDLTSMFPAFPCQDGWSACVVDGRKLDAEPVAGTAGPVSADARVDFWDLTPQASFSPFGSLSTYAGVPSTSPADKVARVDVPKPEIPAADAVREPPQVDVAEADVAKAEVAKAEVAKAEVAKVDGAKADLPNIEVVPAPEATSLRPVSVEIPAAATCADLVALEPPAMLGHLEKGQIDCLQAAYAATSSLTAKEKISRVLMSNAFSKGDIAAWEVLVKRHLDEVDQSDPDLTYKFARQLGKEGKAEAAIHWADVSLERRTVWTGETYKSRVYDLYRLRAGSAQLLWKQAEDAHAASGTDDKAVDAARARTKVAAREWYEYAASAQKDTTTALALCASAAGNADYCTGS